MNNENKASLPHTKEEISSKLGEEKISPIKIENAVVFFADILGFKDLLAYSKSSKYGNDEVENPLLRFQLISHSIVCKKSNINGLARSDSLILWADMSHECIFSDLLDCLDNILLQSFASHPLIKIRSGLAIGDLVVSQAIGDSRFYSTVFYGNAFNDAYKLASLHGLGIRCLLSKEAAHEISKIHPKRVEEFGEYQQYLWPLAPNDNNCNSRNYAEAFLDCIETRTTNQGCVKNIADSLAFLLQFCDDIDIVRRALKWAKSNDAANNQLLYGFFDKMLEPSGSRL